jgi:alpha-ketoglutarate-dependent taurine dioxygenase
MRKATVRERPLEISPPAAGRPFAFIESGGEGLSSLPGYVVDAALRKHGAVLLRGFAPTIQDFRNFTKSLCSSEVFNESPARAVIDRKLMIQTVDLGVDAFPLHPELSREPFQPDVCMFWCLSPPSDGGETTLCDGVEIVRRMPPALLAAFENETLEYRQVPGPEVLEYWLGSDTPKSLVSPHADCPYEFFVNAQGRIARRFFRAALAPTPYGGEPCWNNFIFFGRYFLKLPYFPMFQGERPIADELVAQVKAIADEITVPIQWRKGDITVIDNWRFMHGRNAILDANERKIASYFGYLKNAPRRPGEPENPRWRRSTFVPPRRIQPPPPYSPSG